VDQVRPDVVARRPRCAVRVDLGGSEEGMGWVRWLQERAELDRKTAKAGISLTSSLAEGKLSRWNRTKTPGSVHLGTIGLE